MKIENILPIGTVVELKDIQAKIMIAGYGSVSEQNPNYTWDYSGFVFPLGYSGKETILSFDAVQIRNIVTYGFQDEEQLHFMKDLEEILETIDKGSKEEV